MTVNMKIHCIPHKYPALCNDVLKIDEKFKT